MLRKLGEKLQVVYYIRSLFAERNVTFRAARWDCVLRDGRLLVVRSFLKEQTDLIILNSLLDGDHLPSLYATYIAVTRNWPVLANVDTAY